MQEIISKVQHSYSDFIHGDKFKQIYMLIFSSNQWPFWFFVQAIWECYVVKRSKSAESANKKNQTKNKKLNNKTTENENNADHNDDNNGTPIPEEKIEENPKNQKSKVLQIVLKFVEYCFLLIYTFAMNFAQRELFAIFFNMSSPLTKNKNFVLYFIAVFGLIFLFPFDIIFEIIHFKSFAFILAFAQSASMVRFYKIVLRHVPKSGLTAFQYVPVALLFLSLDFFIEFFFRPIFNWNGRETKVSNLSTLVFNTFAGLLYWMSTTSNEYSNQYLHGRINDQIAAFHLFILLGIHNGINAVLNDLPKKNKKATKKNKKEKKD